jgi:uncharacterized OB-fold protein
MRASLILGHYERDKRPARPSRSQSRAIPPGPGRQAVWASLSEHKLTAQRCGACSKLFSYPPQGSCPHCLSEEYEWVQLSERQSVFVRHLLPRLASVLRRQGALQCFLGGSRRGIALDLQCHRLPAGSVKIGMPVEAIYEDNESYTLPKSRPMK